MGYLSTAEILGLPGVPASDPSVEWQYIDGRTGVAYGPERRLMLALLVDAICTVQDYSPQRAHMRRETVEWFTMKREVPGFKSWVFSFENVCDALGISASATRRVLREHLK